MSTVIIRTIRFEAAHFLPNVPENHKCRRLHGHSYFCEIHVEGEIGDQSGWVCDFADISKEFEPLRTKLDHCLLNDVPGLENPTAENIARWIWQQLCPKLPGLSAVVICETSSSRCVYTGP